jgi:hypothetical protein
MEVGEPQLEASLGKKHKTLSEKITTAKKKKKKKARCIGQVIEC